MKLFEATVILMFAVCSHQLEHLPADVVAQYTQTCLKEVGIDLDRVTKFTREGVINEDEKLKCYFKCKFNLDGRMDANGQMLPTAFDKTIPSFVDLSKADEAAAKCKDLKGNDPCDNAFVIAKCMRDRVLCTIPSETI